MRKPHVEMQEEFDPLCAQRIVGFGLSMHDRYLICIRVWRSVFHDGAAQDLFLFTQGEWLKIGICSLMFVAFPDLSLQSLFCVRAFSVVERHEYFANAQHAIRAILTSGCLALLHPGLSLCHTCGSDVGIVP